MKVKLVALLAAVSLIGLMVFQLGVQAEPVTADTPTYFNLTLLAPTNNPARVQHAQVIQQEMWKIGIGAELVLVGWDVHIPRMFEVPGYNTYDAAGVDIAFIGWTPGAPLIPSVDWYYHQINLKNGTGSTGNWVGLDDAIISDLIDEADKSLIFEERKELILQIMDRAIWEIHPQDGLYHESGVYPYRDYVNNFEASKWSSSSPNLAEMSLTTGDTFTFASQAGWVDLNPSISNSLYDSFIHSPTYSGLYEYDVGWNLRPVLATANPIPLNSTGELGDYIDVTQISDDSPYDGAVATDTWGDNPAIDPEYEATVWETNYSMFLIPIRPDIPWHSAEAYGYSPSALFNVTADDFLWGREYVMDEDHPGPSRSGLIRLFGSAALGFEKINDTMIKVNFKGGTGEGVDADWFVNLAFTAYPQHVLNPEFDATAWGGGVGTYPGGGSIPAIADHKTGHAMNTYSDTEYCIVGNGPYRFKDWNDVTQTATLEKFEDWGGYGDDSLWNDESYTNNNIDIYEYTVIKGKDAAVIALEKKDVDAIDGGNYGLGKDLQYLQSLKDSGVVTKILDEPAVQTMGYNLFHPKLKNRFVRLAISHVIPRQKIVDYILGGLGVATEWVGFSPINPYWPTESEWEDFGLDPSYNSVLPDGKTFSGHIRYDLDKAWALMELAGYDMDPLRDELEGATETGTGDEDSPLPLLPILFAILSLGILRLVHKKRD
jgi:ABC-type transport system substrate-binding protein